MLILVNWFEPSWAEISAEANHFKDFNLITKAFYYQTESMGQSTSSPTSGTDTFETRPAFARTPSPWQQGDGGLKKTQWKISTFLGRYDAAPPSVNSQPLGNFAGNRFRLI
ncbi:MAG: hypothetical protein JSW39_03295 [Desulfobacterales bacterium]|nr:MAG: hypothetical protein JSW39_03295 [Desulfobacterales bacterium]